MQTIDPYWGKLVTAYNRLILGDTTALGVVIFTPYSDSSSADDRRHLHELAQPLIESLDQQQSSSSQTNTAQ